MNDEDAKELDKMCQLSNPKMGRPKVWTDEVIKEFADALVAYSELETSLTLHPFAARRRYCYQILHKLAEMSPYFRDALNIAKINIGNRREQGAITKKFEPKTVSMYARMYDLEYSNYKKQELASDELIKAEAKIKALKKELESKGDIIEYLESQKKIDEVVGE